MNGHSVRWDDGGPRGPGARVILVRPGVGQSITAVCLTAGVVGLWLHWVEGRSVPCLGEKEGCPYHDGGDDWGIRWKGFVGCLCPRYGRMPNQVLEVTADAWRACPILQQLSDAKRLRGVEVELTRGAKSSRSRVSVNVKSGGAVVRYAESLPAAPDTRQLIAVLFKSPASYPAKTEGDGDEKTRGWDSELRAPHAAADENAESVPPPLGGGDGD